MEELEELKRKFDEKFKQSLLENQFHDTKANLPNPRGNPSHLVSMAAPLQKNKSSLTHL